MTVEQKPNSQFIVLKNIANSVVSLLGAMVLAFITSWLLARVLGDSTYGQYVFIFNTFGLILSFADLGLPQIAAREIARSQETAGHYMQTAVFLRLIATFFTLIAAVLMLLSLDELDGQELLALVVVFTTVITSFSDLLRSAFLAFERMEFDLITRVAERGITLILMVGLAAAGLTLENAIWGLLAGSVIGMGITLVFLWRLVPPQGLRFNRDLAGLMLRAGIPMGGSILLVSFYSRYDVLILGILRPSQEVAWFSVAYSFILILVSLSFAASSALLPTFSRRQVVEVSLVTEALRYSLIIGLTVAAFIFIGAEPLVLTIYGESYAPAADALRLLGFTLIFIFPNHLMLNLMLSRNQQNTVLRANLLSGILLLILDPALILVFGVQGAVLANIAVEITIFCLYFYMIGQTVGRMSLLPIARTCAVGGAAIAVYFLTPDPEFLRILSSGLVYVAALFIFRCIGPEDFARLQRLLPADHRLRRIAPIVLLPVLIVSSLLLTFTSAQAQEEEAETYSTLPVTLLGPGDVIRVYDDGSGEPDFNNDTWVFDVGNDDLPQLVIRFSSYPKIRVAQIYTDHNRDGNVDILTEGNQVRVVEAGSDLPVMRVIVNGDWLLPDGKLNWNLRFQTDGAFLYDDNADIPPSIELLNIITESWASYLRLDGVPDMEYEFHDTNQDGIPEYYLWRLLIDTPPDLNVTRARVWSNVGQYVPVQPSEFHLWPLLMSKAAGLQLAAEGTSYFDTPPFIQVDWETANVTPPLFHGYPIEHGFHVHNFEPFEKSRVNYANFEIAQAYYDLAADRDGRPELHIRHRYFDAWDRKAWHLPSPINELKFSWNQFNAEDLSWDFSLGLAGRHQVTEETVFPDFSYLSVPYEQLPQWVTSRNWDISTLIAAETFRYPSSEGIYEWAPVEAVPPLDQEQLNAPGADLTDFRNSLLSRMLSGQDYTVDIPATFDSLFTGMRGEISYTSSHAPYVYLSPIDQKLHLSFADYSIWNFDAGEQQRIYNLNGDETLDQWIYFQGGDVLHQLIHADPYLIYAGEGEVLLKQADVEAMVFQALPPTTHDEWLTFQNRLQASAASLTQGNYRQMLEQFSGEVQRFEDASLSEVRAFDEGIRFVLDVQQHPQHGLEPGRYVVTVQDDTLSFLPLTPPALIVSVETQAIREHTTAQLHVSVRNDGLQDAHNALIELYACPSSHADPHQADQAVLVHTETMDVNAGMETIFKPVWTPKGPGEWQLVAHVTLDAEWDGEEWISDNQPVQMTAGSVRVEAIPAPEINLLLSLNQELPLNGIPVLVIMGCLAISSSALFVLIAKNVGRNV